MYLGDSSQEENLLDKMRRVVWSCPVEALEWRTEFCSRKVRGREALVSFLSLNLLVGIVSLLFSCCAWLMRD